MRRISLLFLFLIPIFSAINAQVKDGDLIKGSKENIYLIVDNKACWIPSKEIFEALKLDWKAVRLIDDKKLDKMAKGSLVFQNKAGDYFLCTNGKVALIGDSKTFKSMKMNEKFVHKLPDAELATLQRVPFVIKGKTDIKYLLIDGKICQIPSDKTFKALGLDPANVTTVDNKVISGFVKAPLLVKGSEEKVFVIEKDKRRWVPSEDVFKKNKFNWNTVYKVDEKTLKNIPEGKPVQ